MTDIVKTVNQELILDISDPKVKIDKATEIANILAEVIKQQKLFANIKGKKHVLVEGWTTLGSLVGLFPVLDFCKKVPQQDGSIVYIAKVLAQTTDGRVISSGQSMCSDKETIRTKDGRLIDRWTEEFEVMSMAQTRATGKALRLPLGWIMALAGFEATPNEEISHLDEKTVDVTATTKNKGTVKQPEMELSVKEEATAWFNTIEHELRTEKGDMKAKIPKADIWMRAVKYKNDRTEVDGYVLTTEVLGALKEYIEDLPADDIR